MMGAELDALDRALARGGTTVIVRRTVAGVAMDANCRAGVRAYRLRDQPFEPSSEQAQDDILVVMSPTDLNTAGWPSAGSGPNYPQRGDSIVIRGVSRVIKVADPIFIGDELVRIDLMVEG